MAKLNCGVVIVLLFAFSARSAEFRDDQFIFTITVPQLGAPPAGFGITRLITQGPGDDGFSPNLNVQVQNVKMTREEYIALSERQFADGKMSVRSKDLIEVDGMPAVMFDAEWNFQPFKLRNLSLAVIRPNDVLLFTCTDKAATFEKHEAEFKKSLASIKLGK